MQDFIDPYTKQTLEKDSDGNLFRQSGGRKVMYKSHHGCYDFVVPSCELKAEREHYDKEYPAKAVTPPTIASVTQQWFDEMLPWRRTFLASLGELAGKRILLVGNGDSNKEFYFHHLGAAVSFYFAVSKR